MDILGYRDSNDGRYYVPVIIRSSQLRFAFGINFLLDTGATRTQLSWNDATEYGRIIIRSLPPENSTYRSTFGGSVDGYLLRGTTLAFKISGGGKYERSIGDLSVSDFQTTDGTMCPIVASVLGIEILRQFDLLFRDIDVIMTLHDDTTTRQNPAKVTC